MINLESILLGLLVVDAIALVVLILLQQGKGADVGAAFGSGGANTVFGGAGSASVLAKLTTWLAIGFFALSFGLAFAAKERAATISDIGLPQVSVPEQGAPGEIGEAVIISGTAAVSIMHFGLNDVFAVPVFAIIILAAAHGNGVAAKCLNLKPMNYLGEISYSIYLSHAFLQLLIPKVYDVIFGAQIGIRDDSTCPTQWYLAKTTSCLPTEKYISLLMGS